MKRREFIAALTVASAASGQAIGEEQSREMPAPPPAGRSPSRSSGPEHLRLPWSGDSSGYLIEIGVDLIVWDHGPGAHHRLLETGHRTVDVTHAFFTHLHYDHCMDCGRLVLQRWDQGADLIPDLNVYGPPPIADDRAAVWR